jgi:holo-[acyl-carrier protein] synthase
MSGSERITNNKSRTYIENVCSLEKQITQVPCAVGVDIVDVQRLQAVYDRWKDALLSRLFTEQEQISCQKASGYRWQSLAGRFSAKEAVKKILGSHGEIASWIEIEILNGRYGEPYITLHGRAQSALEKLGYTHLTLSISHDASLAIATVMAY